MYPKCHSNYNFQVGLGKVGFQDIGLATEPLRLTILN